MRIAFDKDYRKAIEKIEIKEKVFFVELRSKRYERFSEGRH